MGTPTNPLWTYGPIDPWTLFSNRLHVVSCCFTCYIQRMQSTIGKPAQEFRDFAAEARDTVKEFYRLNHTHQTLDFVLAKKADYLARNRKRLGVWDALEFLDTVVDDSDPDVDFTQIDHALQTAEAVRRAGQPRWLIATGLIHDLGKILCVFGEPQWAVVGDTFPVGCQFSINMRLPGVLRRESRSRASGLLDAIRDLRAALRARQRPHVVGTRRSTSTTSSRTTSPSRRSTRCATTRSTRGTRRAPTITSRPIRIARCSNG